MDGLQHQSDRSLPSPPIPDDATEEDGAVLRAVHALLLDDDVIGALDCEEEELRFVGPFSGDSSTDSSGSTTETPPRKVATKYPPARPRMVNRSRVRMQNEIFSLRQKSIALERRLAQIQRDGGAPSATGDATATPSTLWQTTALGQRAHLEAAEREREQLRKKVSDYKQAIKRVRDYLRRQIKKQSTSVKLLPLGISRQTVLHPDAPVGFEDISEYLDSMYAQLDSVFQNEDLDSVTRVTDELNKMRIQNEDSFNMSLEFVKSRVLPYDVATTAKAVWSYHTAKAGGQVQEGSQDTEDKLRRSYVSYVSFPNFKGHVHGRWEARRFVDGDRIIILNCAIYHQIKGAGESMDGVRVRVLNWTVISPPRGEHLRTVSGRSVSHVDSLEIVMPFTTEGSTTRSFTPKELEMQRTFLLKSFQYAHVYEGQVIENALLSGSM